MSGETPIRQVAALAYRIVTNGSATRTEVVLVTSRGTGRWVLPKGNVDKGQAPATAAAREAEEEAGVTGTVSPEPLGSYRYRKWRSKGGFRLARVEVFAMRVERELDQWPERAQRERRWCSPAQAASLVDERELKDLLRNLRSVEGTDEAGTVPVLARSGPLVRWWRRLNGN